jgi:hypothetical protein
MINFRLENGETYEWEEYEGCSDLIDNLDDGEILVLENFNRMDFEEAYEIYKKLLKFKEIIKNIRNKL